MLVDSQWAYLGDSVDLELIHASVRRLAGPGSLNALFHVLLAHPLGSSRACFSHGNECVQE